MWVFAPPVLYNFCNANVLLSTTVPVDEYKSPPTHCVSLSADNSKVLTWIAI